MELSAPKLLFPGRVFLPDDFAFKDSPVEFGDLALQEESLIPIRLLSVFLSQGKEPISEFAVHKAVISGSDIFPVYL